VNACEIPLSLRYGAPYLEKMRRSPMSRLRRLPLLVGPASVAHKAVPERSAVKVACRELLYEGVRGSSHAPLDNRSGMFDKLAQNRHGTASPSVSQQ
jgi:hypothetical protein